MVKRAMGAETRTAKVATVGVTGRAVIEVWLQDVNEREDGDRAVRSPLERDRADRFSRDEPRRRFIQARATLRRLLAMYSGQAPQEVQIGLSEGGVN